MISGNRVERRLAAVMAVDVVGYSRLMNLDEAGTLSRLKKLRKRVFAPAVAEHRGRVVKLMGDGALVEFASVVDAVNAAVSIQETLERWDTNLPAERRARLRIGINLGDVIVEGSDIYGDGVNVAARLQELAGPGEVVLSATAHEHAARKVGVIFDFTGEQSLRNLASPVGIYRWSGKHADSVPVDVTRLPSRMPPGEAGTAAGRAPALARSAAGPFSLAVLPFDNLSDDPNQRYFADGIAEELITALSRVRWFFVIARNSSFRFRGLEAGIEEIGRKLGVRYIVAGSVRRAVARLRITSHLVEVGTRTEIWSDRFEGDVEDVFDVQDRVSASIVGAIEPKLRQAEVSRVRKKPTGNLDAYDRYLRALGLLTPRTPAHYESALAELDRAIELDPDFALAQALSAHCHYVRIVQGWAASAQSETASMIERAEEALSKAPDDPGVLTHAGFALGWGGRGLEGAIQLLARATELNPNSAYGWYVDGWLRMQAGSTDEAIARFERALRLSPLDPISAGSAMAAAGQALILGERYEEAVRWSARAAREAPDLAYAQRVLAASLALSGRPGEAGRARDALLAIEPGFSVAGFLARLPLRETPAMRSLCDGLRLAGLPET